MADYGDEHAREARRGSVNPHRLAQQGGDEEGKGDEPIHRSSYSLPELVDVSRDELYKLREMVGMLGDRMTAVLMPERPEDSGKNASDSHERSPLGDSIDMNITLTRAIQVMVGQLTQRLEL